MGRRGSITESQVFEVADALLAQGREVTPTALLNALGSGSFTTIYKYLNAWEATRTSAGAEKTAAIPEVVLSAFGAAWRAASAEASKEVVLVRDQCAEEVKAANMQFQEALQTIERLEADGEVDAGRIDALNAKLAEMESTLHKMENENAANKATVDQLLERLQRAEKEATQAREEKEKAIKEAAELHGKCDAQQSQYNELLSRLTEPSKSKSDEKRNR